MLSIIFNWHDRTEHILWWFLYDFQIKFMVIISIPAYQHDVLLNAILVSNNLNFLWHNKTLAPWFNISNFRIWEWGNKIFLNRITKLKCYFNNNYSPQGTFYNHLDTTQLYEHENLKLFTLNFRNKICRLTHILT